MAEGLFAHHVNQRNLSHLFEIDSAGTAGYHVGELPDRRMRRTAKRHHIDLTSRARKFTASDLNSFDFILAMDRSNLSDILALSDGEHSATVQLMRDFEPMANADVPDPYYGGDDGFEAVYQLLDVCCTNLLNHLLNQQNAQ